MSLLEELDDEDDARRLDAADRAGRDGDASLAPKLLELALTDPADVRVIGGIAEMYRTVGSAAAGALSQLFKRHGTDEALVRAAARDLGADDAAVGNLLYYLGELANELRAELERDPEPRLRLRALLSVLPTHRSAERTRRALEDPSPLVRAEALTATNAWSEYPRALEDPATEVRLKAAHELRAGTRHTDAILAALEREADPAVRSALVQCLPMRWRDGDKVLDALTRALTEPAVESRRVAARALRNVDRATVGRAIAARCTTETDRHALYDLLSYAHLPRYGRELVPFLAELLEKTPQPLLRSAALHALAGYGVPAVEPLLPLTTHADEEVRKAALFALGAVGGEFTLARVKEVRAKARPPHVRGLDALVAQLEAALAKQGVPVTAPQLEPDRGATPSREGATAPKEGAPRHEPAANASPPAERAGPPHAPSGGARANATDPGGGVPESLVEGQSAAPLHPAGGSPHTILVGRDVLAIGPGGTVAIPPDLEPSTLSVVLVCDACGAHARVTVPISFAYLDDDHYGYQELGYLATRWTNCPRCAATWMFETRFTRTNVRGTTKWTYSWDNGTRCRGAVLTSGPA